MVDNNTHTTNYYNTLIEVADDTKVTCGTVPKSKGSEESVAELQYELIAKHPYKHTSDDVFFRVFAIRNDLTESEYDEARKEYFSKGRPCFRASPLTKTHGFGVHSDGNGKVAVCGMDTEQYRKLAEDPSVKKVKAMRTAKK